MRLIFPYLVLFLSSCSSIIILRDPLTPEEHVNLGYLYERQGKMELAEREYKKAIGKDRKNWLAHYNLGNIYARRGDWDRAEGFYERALRINRDADLLNNLAYVLKEKGEYCRALRLLREATEKSQKPQYFQNIRSVEEDIRKKGIECLPFEGEGELW